VVVTAGPVPAGNRESLYLQQQPAGLQLAMVQSLAPQTTEGKIYTDSAVGSAPNWVIPPKFGLSTIYEGCKYIKVRDTTQL
jgi:hypothetical protein